MSTPSQDGFMPARPKKKRRKGVARVPQRVSFSTRLQNVTTDIVDSEWIKGCQKKMETALNNLGWNPSDVLCLGLGNPVESLNAAAQLALVARDHVSFFDPNFTQEDIDGLLEMRFTVLSENKQGRHALQRRTLLVMPHCGIDLYENVLRENWGVEELQHIFLLGNVLEDYTTATPATKLQREAPCLSRIWTYIACEHISSFEAFPCAFNNLGFQYVRMDSLPQRGDPFWTIPLPSVDKPSAEIVL